MAESDQQEKTEEATQQRREDFRKRGQVAQTKELATVLVLFSMAFALFFLGRFFMSQVMEIFTSSFDDFFVAASKDASLWPAVHYVSAKALNIIAPLGLMFMIMSIMSSLVQVGILQNEEAMKPKLEKLDPTKGLKRIFSLRSLVEGIKAVFKVILVVAVVYLVLEKEIFRVPQLMHFTVGQTFTYVGELSVKILGAVGILMGFLAAFDYFFQRFELEKQMRMSKQEVKEETKSREGDPLVKARIRRVQREMAQRRMMEDVPKADVIITNPTHIAVALQYDPSKFAAPRLIAAGAGAIAQKIKEVARENNVPVVENKPLARTIFKTMKIGEVIPRELFTAVAQVLSYVFKLKKRVRA